MPDVSDNEETVTSALTSGQFGRPYESFDAFLKALRAKAAALRDTVVNTELDAELRRTTQEHIEKIEAEVEEMSKLLDELKG